MIGKVGLFLIALFITLDLAGQDHKPDSALLKTDLFIAELDSMLSVPEDSAVLLQLIDSLLKKPKPYSQLMLRLGYNSNIVSASRTIGLNQFGLAPGISYYHKSGLYLDATGHWSREYSPSYYLSVLSAGYMKSLSNWWALMAEYSRYIYSPSSDSTTYTPYTDNLGVSNFFDVGKFTFRADYQFYFGQKSAHRIMPGIMVNFEKKNLGKLKRMSFVPSFYLLLGSEEIQVFDHYDYVPYTTRPLEILFRIRNNLPLYYQVAVTRSSSRFGILNYSISAPISFQFKKWSLLLNYTYNFPKTLPGEVTSLSNSGYFSASITRKIIFR